MITIVVKTCDLICFAWPHKSRICNFYTSLKLKGENILTLPYLFLPLYNFLVFISWIFCLHLMTFLLLKKNKSCKGLFKELSCNRGWQFEHWHISLIMWMVSRVVNSSMSFLLYIYIYIYTHFKSWVCKFLLVLI